MCAGPAGLMKILPIRAYVPSGIAMLRSVGTNAFPLAGTVTSVELRIN